MSLVLVFLKAGVIDHAKVLPAGVVFFVEDPAMV
jgi:hypothetical protein